MAILSDETLVAYVDGELDADRAAEVEATLALDDEAHRTVQIFRDSAAVVGDAFDGPLHEPVPESVLKSLDVPGETAGDVVDLADRRDSRERARQRRFGLPLAASIALAIGLGGGYQLSGLVDSWQSASDGGSLLVEAKIDGSVLGQALETTASNVAIAWHEPASGRRGEITPVSTFKDKHGRFCREYERREISPGNDRLRPPEVVAYSNVTSQPTINRLPSVCAIGKIRRRRFDVLPSVPGVGDGPAQIPAIWT